jgi:hypothetical protein
VKVLNVGADYGEAKGEAVELGAGQMAARVGWSKDGQVRLFSDLCILWDTKGLELVIIGEDIFSEREQ